MSRSLWKGFWVSPQVLKNFSSNDLPVIKNRNSCIPSSYIGKRVKIHNGRLFKIVAITREKIGYKFGEFCLTRQRISHSTKKTNKKKK